MNNHPDLFELVPGSKTEVTKRKNYKGKRYQFIHKHEQAQDLKMTPKGGFSVNSFEDKEGNTIITRKKRVKLKAKGSKRKKMETDLDSAFNDRDDSEDLTVRAHGIADMFGAPAKERNMTWTTEQANKFDTLGEVKMRAKIQKVAKTETFNLFQQEVINPEGKRIKKASVLQRQGSKHQDRFESFTPNG